jgi:hypothetical protein
MPVFALEEAYVYIYRLTPRIWGAELSSLKLLAARFGQLTIFSFRETLL